MASDSWFRFYNTAVDHPKVMMLSDAHFRAWVRLMSLASKLGGVIPADLPLIAQTLRKSSGKAADILQVLQSAVLLDPVDGGGWRPHNWNEKQFKSDVSTDRVRAFRERSRNVSETDHKQRQSTETKKKKDNALSRFQDFWAVCPKKTGQGAAEKAWPRALALVNGDAEVLIAGMRAYAATCPGKDRSFIKTPGPWLNEKRWTDEGIAPSGPTETVSQAEIDAAKDKADRYYKRGIYAPNYNAEAA